MSNSANFEVHQATVRRISEHLEKVLLDAADTPISNYELAQTLAEQALASVDTTTQEAAQVLLMVENIDDLSALCRKFNLSGPKFFALLRSIAQGDIN